MVRSLTNSMRRAAPSSDRMQGSGGGGGRTSSASSSGVPHQHQEQHDSKHRPRRRDPRTVLLLLPCLVVVVMMVSLGLGGVGRILGGVSPTLSDSTPSQESGGGVEDGVRSHTRRDTRTTTTKATPRPLPDGLDAVLDRANRMSETCDSLASNNNHNNHNIAGPDLRRELPFHNDTVASLPAFGIRTALQTYQTGHSVVLDQAGRTATPPLLNHLDVGMCHMPPPTECEETQLSVVLMAYNPDRLGTTLRAIQNLLGPHFHNLVYEVILVWNGDRQVDESPEGKALLEYARDHPLRLVYPLTLGLPNDLMNRYHPRVVQPLHTKALLYYDDDGPFYSYEAVRAGWELWKRHSRAQIGAMARQITTSARQQEEHARVVGGWDPATMEHKKRKPRPDDAKFVSHCTNLPSDDKDTSTTTDAVDYQFRFFANYDANMVLPSGSLLHANYLCYLWHEVFAEIRQFVLDHPVHPDDMTVSMIVSQLAGVAPRVYSRKLPSSSTNANKKNKTTSRKQQQRRQLTHVSLDDASEAQDHDESDDREFAKAMEVQAFLRDRQSSQQQQQHSSSSQHHRRLMFSICWDCGSGMSDMKQYWAELRTEAIQSLVRYFGSLNTGSVGWCTPDSEFYHPTQDGRCQPKMAQQGDLDWMNPDGSPKDTCP